MRSLRYKKVACRPRPVIVFEKGRPADDRPAIRPRPRADGRHACARWSDLPGLGAARHGGARLRRFQRLEAGCRLAHGADRRRALGKLRARPQGGRSVPVLCRGPRFIRLQAGPAGAAADIRAGVSGVQFDAAQCRPLSLAPGAVRAARFQRPHPLSASCRHLRDHAGKFGRQVLRCDLARAPSRGARRQRDRAVADPGIPDRVQHGLQRHRPLQPRKSICRD